MLYREAEARRQRKQRREEEAWSLAQQQSRPKIGRNSRALCQNRLERELRAVFIQLLHQGVGSAQAEVAETPVLSVPRGGLALVLESLGLLGEADEEEEFCEKLGYLLDREDSGHIAFQRLLTFLQRALDREGVGQSPRPQAASLEEECFWQLEQELLKDLGRLLPNRHTRPKSPGRSASLGEGRSASPSPAVSARSFPALPSSEASAPAEIGTASQPEIPAQEQERRPGAQRMFLLGSQAAPPTPRTAGFPRPQSAPNSARGAAGTPRGRPLSANARKAASATAARGGRASEAMQISRCHLLYHQAVFASKESAQLEEDIKSLRQREEMRECTFRPKLHSSARRSSSTPAAQPRNFETAVARMRTAYQRRVEREEEKEHIPCGENYDRLRRLGTQPFSFYTKDKARSIPQSAPLMYIDVNVGHGRTGRIKVREGDDLRQLSRNFARTFQLDQEMATQLETLLREAYLAHRQGAALPVATVPAEAGTPDRHQGFNRQARLGYEEPLLEAYSPAEHPDSAFVGHEVAGDQGASETSFAGEGFQQAAKALEELRWSPQQQAEADGTR